MRKERTLCGTGEKFSVSRAKYRGKRYSSGASVVPTSPAISSSTRLLSTEDSHLAAIFAMSPLTSQIRAMPPAAMAKAMR